MEVYKTTGGKGTAFEGMWPDATEYDRRRSSNTSRINRNGPFHTNGIFIGYGHKMSLIPLSIHTNVKQ